MNSPDIQHSSSVSNYSNVTKISEIISHLRAYLNLSQAKFAAPLGLSPTQIARFKRGIYVPSPEIIKQICEVFDVDKRLFGDSSMTVEEAVASHDIISEISARIRSERKEKGWSQTELAKCAGLTTNTIYRIETGQINLTKQTAIKLASALEVGVDWLMRGNKDRKNYPADQKMTDWLWEHPDVREKIWDMMKNEE